MRTYKFDDCKLCRFKRRRDICEDCDWGEMFEDSTAKELDFSDTAAFDRTSTPLTSEDDEPEYNPDDLFKQVEDAEIDEDIIEDYLDE